jgi:hypothetical protein
MSFGHMPDEVPWHEKVLAPFLAAFGLLLLCVGVVLISAYLSLLDLIQSLRAKHHD